MANITADDRNYTRSAGSVDGLYLFFAALNFFLSITASLSNAVILMALHKVTSIYPPTKLLFRCLAVSDLCVGLISQPTLRYRSNNSEPRHYLGWDLHCFNNSLGGSIDIDINCNKFGQASRSDDEAEIQTCCNITTTYERS